jgi:glyoxylase-like metal-dependent hydrolase (beta-lactamase superfamily II)
LSRNRRANIFACQDAPRQDCEGDAAEHQNDRKPNGDFLHGCLIHRQATTPLRLVPATREHIIARAVALPQPLWSGGTGVKRGIVLATLVVAGALSAVVGAYQQPANPPAQRVVEVEKLRENLFVLRGGGGNTAVFVTTNGVVVVDTKNPGWGQPILDKIKELTNKPVTTIINTHTHGDHVSGNVEFPPTVDVVTHENTAANMKAMRSVTGFKPQPNSVNIFETSKGVGLPKRTFKDTMTIGSGGDQVDVYYFGRGHTNGDAWIVFPTLRVMHAGDIFSGKNLPLLDANNGGSGLEIGNTLAKAHSGVKGVESIITGHSTVMTMADLKEYADFNREFAQFVQEGKKAGRSPSQIAEGWKLPDKYKGYASTLDKEGKPIPRILTNVEVIFDEIK